MLTPVPAELEQAIQNSCRTFKVPQDIMRGVWVKESGASFPDTAVNSAGYGGLFGTKDYAVSVQDQANYAANVLHDLYSQYHNWRLVLYHYSGGGYTTLPGGYDFLMGLTDDQQNQLLSDVETLKEYIVNNVNEALLTGEGTGNPEVGYSTMFANRIKALVGDVITSTIKKEIDEIHSVTVQAPSSPVGQDTLPTS